MDIKKKVCDECKKETDRKGMYLTIESPSDREYFRFTIKYLAGHKTFTWEQLDFCSVECLTTFLEKLLMKNP